MAHIQIRISEEEKILVQKVCDHMGLTLSGAIKLFLRKMIQEKKIPFEISSISVERFSRDVLQESPFSSKKIEQ